MKALFALSLALLPVLAGQADTIETAIVAAMKLSEEPNYSWRCTVMDDAQSYAIEGKTERGGYTWQRQPMPKVVARRLGREAGWELDALFKDWNHYVIQTPDGWKRLEELPKLHDDWVEQEDWYYTPVRIVRSPDMPADETMLDPFGLPPAIYVPVLRAREEEESGAYSNAQFALALPHEELAVIVSSHDEFQVDGDIASGTLTDLGSRLLLVHDGHEYIRPVIATGRFKLWLGAGRVSRYLVELAGIVLVDRKPIYVRQRSSTWVSDVGKTTVEVPADARRRLDG